MKRSLTPMGLAAFTVLLSLSAPAAVEPPSRPRIGLVLAGGGARGAAHIGVLEVLEELRVPVDYVAGTSMGSIMGGLYAAGYSPEEMEQAIGRIDWASAFNDRPPRQEISFRQKEDDRDALMKFEIGLSRRGFRTPAGLIAGSKINFILRAMTLHVSDIEDFDALAVPFRAVAADLETGDAVVLSRGNLAEAMRASMSIPGVFTPMKIEGRQLVDGGIAMNLPVDVAREMGAEIILAIDVGTPPKAYKEESSAFGVASRTMSLLSERNVIEQRARLGARDLLVTPDLEGISAASFNKLLPAVARGEAAARAVAERLRELSMPEEEYAAFLARQRSFGPKGKRLSVTVREVQVTGLNRMDPRIVSRRLRTRPGDVLDLPRLQDDLARVNQIGEFERVDFNLKPEADGSKLEILAQEKSWGPGFLRLGFSLRSDLEGSGDFTFLANYRRTLINRLGAEWKTIVKAGDVDSLSTEFYQPLDFSGFWFVAPHVDLERDRDDFFLPGGVLAPLEVRRRSAGLDIGVQFRNWGEIRLGAIRGTLDVQDRGTTAGRHLLGADLGAWRGRLILDHLDNAYFPRQGTRIEIDGLASRESLGADFQYDKASLQISQAWSVHRSTLFAAAEAGTNFGTEIPFYDQFRLGGFFRLSGLEQDELQGQVLGLASLGYYWQVARLPAILGGGVYVGGAIQAGNAWQDASQARLDNTERSGMIFIGAETPLGPAYFGYGRTRHSDSFYLILGRVF